MKYKMIGLTACLTVLLISVTAPVLLSKTPYPERVWQHEEATPAQACRREDDGGLCTYLPIVEINTGGVSRGYRKTPYPALFLLREWKAMGGRVILTSDTHSADTVVYGYTQAAELARAAGFDRSILLTLAGPVECAL